MFSMGAESESVVQPYQRQRLSELENRDRWGCSSINATKTNEQHTWNDTLFWQPQFPGGVWGEWGGSSAIFPPGWNLGKQLYYGGINSTGEGLARSRSWPAHLLEIRIGEDASKTQLMAARWGNGSPGTTIARVHTELTLRGTGHHNSGRVWAFISELSPLSLSLHIPKMKGNWLHEP